MPVVIFLCEEKAVVQAVGAVDPEFDLLGMEMVAAPVGWGGNFAGVVGGEGLGCCFQCFAGLERAALVGDGGADLALAAAAVEVGIDVGGAELGDAAFDADLAAEGFPVEAEGGAGVFGELAAFLAFGVGEEAEAMAAGGLDEDHADAGCCGGAGGVGVVGLALPGFFEPGVEES